MIEQTHSSIAILSHLYSPWPSNPFESNEYGASHTDGRFSFHFHHLSQLAIGELTLAMEILIHLV